MWKHFANGAACSLAENMCIKKSNGIYEHLCLDFGFVVYHHTITNSEAIVVYLTSFLWRHGNPGN